jgi:hypothetical protein
MKMVIFCHVLKHVTCLMFYVMLKLLFQHRINFSLKHHILHCLYYRLSYINTHCNVNFRY